MTDQLSQRNSAVLHYKKHSYRTKASKSWPIIGLRQSVYRNFAPHHIPWYIYQIPFYYRATPCQRGICRSRVSICLSVCLSQVGVLVKRLNVGSHKQTPHRSPGSWELQFSGAKSSLFSCRGLVRTVEELTINSVSYPLEARSRLWQCCECQADHIKEIRQPDEMELHQCKEIVDCELTRVSLRFQYFAEIIKLPATLLCHFTV